MILRAWTKSRREPAIKSLKLTLVKLPSRIPSDVILAATSGMAVFSDVPYQVNAQFFAPVSIVAAASNLYKASTFVTQGRLPVEYA